MTFDEAMAIWPGVYTEADRDRFNEALREAEAQNRAIEAAQQAQIAERARQVAAQIAALNLPQNIVNAFDLEGTGYGSADQQRLAAERAAAEAAALAAAQAAAATAAAQTTPPIVVPANLDQSMTLQQYANRRPDILASWNAAQDPANAGDPNVPGILAFGSYENFLRASAAGEGIAIVDTAPAAGGSAGSGAAAGGGGGGAAVNPIVVPRPGAVDMPPGGVSRLFDPTHRLVGYTAQGFEVYRLTDEGGRLVEWYDIPGQGAQGEHYLSGPNDPASYVRTTQRPRTQAPAVIDQTRPPATTGTGGTSKTALIVGGALVLGAIVYFAGRKNRRR